MQSAWDQSSLKLGIAVILFIEVLFFSQLPYFSPKISASKTIMDIFNSLSIGILLGVAFFHMIPEANEKLEHFDKFLWFKSPQQQNHGHSHSHSFPFGSLISLVVFFLILAIEIKVHDHHQEAVARKPYHMKKNVLEGKGQQRRVQYLNTILIQIALSLHCFFECMSIGVEGNKKAMFTLAFTVMLHKWAEALTLGYSYYSTGMSQFQAIKFSVFHGLLNATAVIFGYWTTHDQTLAGVFNGIAGGTFLYVCFIQKIGKNFRNQTNLIRKLALVFTGMIFIILIS